MGKEDALAILADLETYVKETTSSEEKAIEALVAAGFLETNGQVKAPYRD